MDSLNLERCDFIKIDIEGAEYLAFLGGENTIKKFKPVIAFEHHGPSEMAKNILNSDNVPDAKELIESYGYKTEQHDQINYIAIPL